MSLLDFFSKKQHLQVTGKELTALQHFGAMMASADGRVDDSEYYVLSKELMRFGVTEEQLPVLLNASEKMTHAEALRVISSMNEVQKKYAAAYLGTILGIDGDINDKELALWAMVSTLCGLPKMSVSDAIKYMDSL